MKIKVKQRDITDCGAACLSSIASYYKVSIPFARIRQLACTDKKGTNVLGLVEAALKIGFIAKGVRGEWDSIFKIPKPAIAHLLVKKSLYHYVVVLNSTKKHIKIMDPADGEIHKVKHDKFKEQWTGVLVLVAPGEKFTVTREKISTSSRFFSLIKPHRSIFIQALIGAMIFSVLGLGMSIYIGKLVDYVLPGGNVNLLNLMGIAMVFIILLRILINYFQTIFVMKTGQKIDASLIFGYYKHLLKLPQSFFDNMRTGEIISRIGDAVKIRLFINEVSINLVLNIFILFVSFILMFSFYPKLAFLTLVIIPFYIITYLVSNRLNKKVQRKVMEDAADLEAQLVESLNSASTIKMFGIEEFANFKTETRFVKYLETIYKSGLNSIFSSISTGMVTQVFILVILWIGAGYAIGNKITAGELMTFYSITGYFTGPVAGIIGFNRTLQDAGIAADRLFEIFDLETDETSSKLNLTSELIGDIHFEDVKFRYGTRSDVFDELNLTIKKGEITAIAGESGSGKTTLISLLQNLYSLQSGHIRIGKYDIKNFTNHSLRQSIVAVPQRIDLFAGNIIENIALGEINPDMAKILKVCTRLGMIDFIEELPHGFNTYIGENGATLSGGQKQRIAIARALYRDPEVLILDEATSHLDSLSETFVRNAIRLLKDEGKTIIIIAHRLPTIKMADRIIVLEKGLVVQEGIFADLVSKSGPFRKMWEYQSIELLKSV